MKRAIPLSAAIYRALVRLYPAELRQRWGPEMAETFALQIEDASAEGGWLAVMETWSYAVAEFVHIALPLRLTPLMVPALSLVATSAIFFGLVWALENSLALGAAYRHLVTKLGG